MAVREFSEGWRIGSRWSAASNPGMVDTRAEAPLLLRWTLLKYIGPILDNMREAEKILESTSDINYSVILPAGLKNGNQSGMYGK